jgi:hypothetical protein
MREIDRTKSAIRLAGTKLLGQRLNRRHFAGRVEDRDAILHAFAMRQQLIVGCRVGASRRGHDRHFVGLFQQIQALARPPVADQRTACAHIDNATSTATVLEEAVNSVGQRVALRSIRNTGRRRAALRLVTGLASGRRFVRRGIRHGTAGGLGRGNAEKEQSAEFRPVVDPRQFVDLAGSQRCFADESCRTRSDRLDRSRSP